MKRILIKILLIFTIFSLSGINSIINTYAENTADKKDGITVNVTEKIPGAGCEENKEEPGMYECTIEKGFGSVIKMMGKIIKYFTYIASLGGVLFIVINGIMYSMGGAEPSMKDDAKKRIIGTLTGLILLFLSGVILNLIAPWIYK